MKTAVVSLSELTEDSTLCMSPHRIFKECHKCDKLRLKRIQNMRCKPQIKDEVIKLMERKEELLRELNEINKALE